MWKVQSVFMFYVVSLSLFIINALLVASISSVTYLETKGLGWVLSLFLNSIDRFTWILKHWKARFLLNSFFQHLTWRSGCLTSSWIELQTLLRYCLIHATITTPRHFLYLVYFLPCLGPGLCYIFVISCTFEASFSLWLII